MNIKYINGNKSTNINNIDEVTFITFPKLEKANVKHGFSTRLGGVSKDYLGSMNLSFHRQDDEKLVMENHKRFAKAIGYDESRLVFSDQVHKTHIHKVTARDMGKGIVKKSDICKTDGLVTDEKGIPLITFYADCVPLFFYDPVKKVIGMAHSGWKGTVAKIGNKMVQYFCDNYGSKSEDIICAIGPSICQNCYEVSKDVADEFRANFPLEQFQSFIIDKGNGKYLLDLHKANTYILLDSGILKSNLDVTDICTCCNPEFLFSHRASQGKRGNLGAVMVL